MSQRKNEQYGIPISDLIKKYGGTTKKKLGIRRTVDFSDLFDPDEAKMEEAHPAGSSWSDMLADALKSSAKAIISPASMFLPNGADAYGAGLLAETAGNILQSLGTPDNSLASQYAPNSGWAGLKSGLRSLGDVAQNAADTAIEYGNSQVAPSDNNTFAGSLANAIGGGFLGVMSGDASMIHADKTANALNSAIQQLQDNNAISPELSTDYILSPHGLTRSFGNLAGSMLAIAPTMALAPESVGIKAGDIITRGLINQGAYGLAKRLAPNLPAMTRYAITSAPAEGIAEGGHVRRENLEQGVSDSEATRRSINTALMNTPLLMATNLIESGLLGMPFGSATSALGKVAEAGARTAGNAFQQATEEALQKAISNAQTGKQYGVAPWNWTPDQQEDFWEGFAGTLPMGIASGGAHAITKPPEESEEIRAAREDYDRGSGESISAKDFAKRSDKQSKANQYNNLRKWADKISDGQMSDDVFNAIVRNAQAYGVPVKVALAQATAESEGRQDVVSPVGAIGVMQLMPETAEELGVDPNDAEQNIRGGMKYLKKQYDRYGDWNLALAAYNAGAGNVTDHVPQNGETEHYVKRINDYLDESPYYERDKGIRSEGITYLGENGKGEGKYWVRQGEHVSLEGAHEDLPNAIDMLAKWYYERTGKRLVVTAGTNGTHAEGEHSHGAGWKVDVNDFGGGEVSADEDGALTTADFHKGKLADDFIAYGRSLGLGMNWEGDGTSNVHIDVALDGTQWDGNGDNAGGFSLNRARANSRTNADYERQEDVSAVRNNNRDNKATSTETVTNEVNNDTSETLPPPPPATNGTNLFADFANEKITSSTGAEAAEAENFFAPMFTDSGKFKDTLANRQAIRYHYGDEFVDWVKTRFEGTQNQQTETPKAQQTPPTATQQQQPPTPITVRENQQQEQQPPSQAENVVQDNKTPENILSTRQAEQPKTEQQFGYDERLASQAPSTSPSDRADQASAIMRIVNFNRVELPKGLDVALKNNPSSKAILTAQELLRSKNLIPASPQPVTAEERQQRNPAFDTGENYTPEVAPLQDSQDKKETVAQPTVQEQLQQTQTLPKQGKAKKDTRSPQQKNKDKLYENIKAESHPRVKALVDWAIAKASDKEDSKGRHEAQAALRVIRSGNFKPYELEMWEQELEKGMTSIPQLIERQKAEQQEQQQNEDKATESKAEKFLDDHFIFVRQDENGELRQINSPIKSKLFNDEEPPADTETAQTKEKTQPETTIDDSTAETDLQLDQQSGQEQSENQGGKRDLLAEIEASNASFIRRVMNTPPKHTVEIRDRHTNAYAPKKKANGLFLDGGKTDVTEIFDTTYDEDGLFNLIAPDGESYIVRWWGNHIIDYDFGEDYDPHVCLIDSKDGDHYVYREPLPWVLKHVASGEAKKDKLLNWYPIERPKSREMHTLEINGNANNYKATIDGKPASGMDVFNAIHGTWRKRDGVDIKLIANGKTYTGEYSYGRYKFTDDEPANGVQRTYEFDDKLLPSMIQDFASGNLNHAVVGEGYSSERNKMLKIKATPLQEDEEEKRNKQGSDNEEGATANDESTAGTRADSGRIGTRDETGEEVREDESSEDSSGRTGRPRQGTDRTGEDDTQPKPENKRPVRVDETENGSTRTGSRTSERSEESPARLDDPEQREESTDIEQRAIDAIKEAGLANAEAHYATGISVEIQPISESKIVDGKIRSEVRLKFSGARSGLVNIDADNVEKLAKVVGAGKIFEDDSTRYIADRDDALVLKRALEKYFGNSKASEQGIETKETTPSAEKLNTTRNNFHITEDSGVGEGGLKTKFRQNIDAIKLLKKIESEGRMATPEEQAILAKFNGWGTIAAALSGAKGWEKEKTELREILTEDEYTSALQASPNAFYTSPKIASIIWKAVARLGFKGGRVLDPSTGSGIFFGTMPVEFTHGSTLVGTELDDLTGRIAKQLYQNADIEITGFQNRPLPDNYFDLAISNVPFGDMRIKEDPDYSKHNFALHNYFFAKSIDKIRPGGLMVFITSTGTLQTQSNLYEYLNQRADLIAAYKLPNTAFDKNAGTQVTTDIVIFQKRFDARIPSEHAQRWQNIDTITLEDKSGRYLAVGVNEYFNGNPAHMIGKMTADTLYGHRARLALDGTGRDVTREFTELVNELPENISPPINRTQATADNKTFFASSSKTVEGTLVINDGKVYQQRNGKLVEFKNEPETAKDYIHLLGTLDALLRAQRTPNVTDEKLSELRQTLNRRYDNFVKKHGYLNSPKNVRLLAEDPNYGKLAAIENYKEEKKGNKVIGTTASKTAIFSKRTTNPNTTAASANTAVDALIASLSSRGRIDMDYMSDLTGKGEKELEKELGDYLYKNPDTNQHELAEEYLSGNVRAKLARAKEAARTNPDFQRNVKALEKVQPRDLDEKDITIQIGSTWIDHAYYEDFVVSLLSGSGTEINRSGVDVSVQYSKGARSWDVIVNPRSWTLRQAEIAWHVSSQHGKASRSFGELVEAALNHKYPIITYTEGKKTYIDEVATADARAKVQRIRDSFDKWIWEDNERKKDLLGTYNAMFNSNVQRKYDGSNFIIQSALAEDVKEKLYPHQKDAIWRIVQGKNVLLAHCVGAGKTWTMQIAAMEMKRLGIIHKPMFVVPKSVVKQFEAEFRQAYPEAKLLVLDNANLPQVKDNPENRMQRQKILSKVVVGDWDGIIITHNLFQRLPVSPEAMKRFTNEEIKILESDLEARVKPGEKPSNIAKKLGAMITKLKEKLSIDNSQMRKEICIPFDELGIDQIFVDEADVFKNLHFASQLIGSRGIGDMKVVGVANPDAGRSRDLYLKTRVLSSMRNGGGVVFATGTPVSNTLCEIYTMMRYLNLPELEDKNMEAFDAWTHNFVKMVESIELSPSGKGFETVLRLKLTNLMTLINSYRQIADIKMPEDLPSLKRPKLKGGTRTVVEIEASASYREYLDDIQERAKAIHAGLDPALDNMLKVTNDLRHASLDMRLIDPSLTEAEGGAKIAAACNTILAKYKETATVKGAQVVFLDLGIPKSKEASSPDDTDGNASDAQNEEVSETETSTYQRIKDGLIKRGIPANQIAFVHDAKNDAKRRELFERVNNGEIRVIIGSTEKMGAGVNFQKHLVALHHLDCPWRPRDIEQREGRILRAGNQNQEVEIFTYVTKGSYDANTWEKVMLKKEMMDAFLRGDETTKEIEDVESKDTMSYEDIMSRGINEEEREISALNSKLRALQYEQTVFNNGKLEKGALRARLRREVAEWQDWVNNLKADIASRTSTKGNAFKMKIGDTEYTNRTEASKALEQVIEDFDKPNSSKVGEIGGFTLNLKAEYTYTTNGSITTKNKIIHAQLKNHSVYGVEPSLRSIEHITSQNGLEKTLETAEKGLQTREAKLNAVVEELSSHFPKKAELEEVRAKLSDLRASLGGHGDSTTIEMEEVNPPEEQAQDVTEQAEEETRYNIQGAKDKINTATNKIVDNGELTPAQKLLQTFGKRLGVRVIFVSNPDRKFFGVHKQGVTYLNINSEKPLEQVFWHESLHWLKNNNPNLYKALVKAAGITEAQREDYLVRSDRTDLANKEDIDEEILADQMDDVAKRTGLLKNIAGENRGLIERFVQWLKDTLNKFIEHFRNQQGKLTTAQAQALSDEFGRIATQLKDPNGNKIFQYNRRTHNIELANGRDLSDENITAMAAKNTQFEEKLDTSGEKTDTKNESDNKPNFFRRAWHKFADALNLSGDKIVTGEDRQRALRQAQEKAMAAYLKEPSNKNKNALKELGVTRGQLDAYMNGEEYVTEIGLRQNVTGSPSRIAEKNQIFRAFFNMGDRAMDKLIKLRDSFSRHYGDAMAMVKSKEDREQLIQLLWDGDEEQKEFTKAELLQDGVKENVANAYLAIRRQLGRAYTMLDAAQRGLRKRAANMSADQIQKLRKNKFVKQDSINILRKEEENGNYLVKWEEYGFVERELIVNPIQYVFLAENENVQILSEREIDDDGTMEVTIRECTPALERLKGYIPHFFHEYAVVVRDANGKQVGAIIGTGRTQREAIKLAKEWQKNNTLKDGEQIHIQPHNFNFGMDGNYTPIMGDKDYEIMMRRITERTGMTLAEAERITRGAVKLKNRHRFLGQLLQRKGYAGYEKDMDWVLRHHFNSVARYVALETEFKPKAISLFERVFGAFDKDYSKNLMAKYTKDYINDVNGVPAWIDEAINNTLNQNPIWRKYVLPNVGARGGQRLANNVVHWTTLLKLGMFNISSAMINFTQLINAAGYVGWSPLMKHFGQVMKRKGKLTLGEMRILNGSGVLQDLGLDTASGYDKDRGYTTEISALKWLNWLGNKSMIPFQKCDTLCRISTALAAYDKATAEGKSRAEALAYAKKVNRDANFSYGVEDAPNLFRRTSSVGKVLLQFYKYPLKEFELMADFLPQNKKTTLKQKAAFWLPYFFACGLMGFIPFFDWGDDWLNKTFGLFPKDFMQQMIMEWLNGSEAERMMAKVIMYGAPALANIDASKRVGMAGLATPNSLFGTAGSTVWGVGSSLAQGNFTSALRNFSPGLFNLYMAAVGGETHNARGRKMSAYEDAYSRIIRGLGFTSVDETVERDIDRIAYNSNSERIKREQRAIDAYIADETPENRKRLKELGISPDRVKTERRKKKLGILERREENIPKKQRREYEELSKFAR